MVRSVKPDAIRNRVSGRDYVTESTPIVQRILARFLWLKLLQNRVAGAVIERHPMLSGCGNVPEGGRAWRAVGRRGALLGAGGEAVSQPTVDVAAEQDPVVDQPEHEEQHDRQQQALEVLAADDQADRGEARDEPDGGPGQEPEGLQAEEDGGGG